MLWLSSHAWKVNFCKFTNETRNGIEDSSAHSGLKFLAALNGATAGGGYELALACDEIAMIDDRSSTVSLPEVPLLGVLPGTGGLTRLVDKRKVRRDLADVFCTTAEGVRAERGRQWKLVDHVFKPQQFADLVKHRALELARQSDRPGGAGVALTPLGESKLVEVKLDLAARTAEITVKGPEQVVLERDADWYPPHLPDGQRLVPHRDAFLRPGAVCSAERDAGFRACRKARPGHLDAGRDRLGGRSSHRARGAREPEPRRADRDGSLPALRRPGNDADARVRAAHRVAELDLPAAQCGRRSGRAQGLRHRLESEIQLGAGMSAIDYAEKIPNNVNLVGDRTLQRALERWQPQFLQWWHEMGPNDFEGANVYLRTAVSVDAQGWAHYGAIRMPDYRWGIFLADPVAGRKIGFGDAMGQPAWQQVPGEYRSTLRRLIVTQGDTEPASVEQQRLLGHTCPSLYDLRNLFQINVEEGRHLWAMEIGRAHV